MGLITMLSKSGLERKSEFGREEFEFVLVAKDIIYFLDDLMMAAFYFLFLSELLL
jgi:hypothetical protein